MNSPAISSGGNSNRTGSRMSNGSAFHGVVACALLALATILATPAAALPPEVEARKVLDTSALGDPFVFDVGPDGVVLVLTGDNIFDATAKESLFGEPLKDPAWLAFAGKNLQFLVDGALYVVEGRIPRKLLEVPLKNCVFVSDGERTFISGISGDGKPLLFLYKEGVGHKALLELDAPIDAMALARGELYFSAGSRIYELREGGPVRLFANLPGFSRISSIALDDARGLFFFSDGDDIYAVRGGDFAVVRKGLGGMLRSRAGDLYVLSFREHTLFRVNGLSEAILSAGTLAPWKDPCEDPVIGLYCLAERERATLRAAVELSGSGGTSSHADAFGEMAAFVADRKKEVDRLGAALAKEAATGVEGIVWGGRLEAKAIGANTSLRGGKRGARISLWDGSDLRVGPDSKAVLGECRPSGTCRQTLEKGLFYFEAAKPPVEGMAVQTLRGFVIATEALSLQFTTARLTVFASGDRTAVVVLEGRVKAVTPQGESVIVASGETFEARRGERPESPKPAEMERVKTWWEDIR